MPERLWFGETGPWPICAGFAAALVIAAVASLDPFGLASLSREHAFDLLYAAFPRQPGKAKVLVVDIDEASLAKLGTWPLPRAELAALLDKLGSARPAVIAFDIFFASPDRHSPRALANELASLPGGEKVRALVAEMPDTDARFAEALRNSPSVLGALAAAGDDADFNPIETIGRLDGTAAIGIDGVSGPYRPLADAALGLGILSLFGEGEGIVRRVPLLLATGDAVFPSLALEAARVAVGTTMLQVDGRHDKLHIGGRTLRLREGGTMRLHWSTVADWRRRTVSAADVLDGKVAADRIAKAVVLVGASAPQAGALWSTAREPLTPSVQIEAEAVEQILSGQMPHLPQLAGLSDFLATLAFGLLGARLSLLRGPAAGSLAQATLIIVWLVIVVTTFVTWEVLFDPIGPAIASVVSGSVAAAVAFAQTRRLKRLISQRFEQYLAPDLVRAIVAKPERLRREGETREVTALFTDVEGFTALLSRVGPKQLVALLDPYFDGVCRVITAHGGMIDLIVGDAVHAFFNMPLDLPNHADRALDCALAITRFAETFRVQDHAARAGFGRTRIGVETGTAIVGDVGGPGRVNYTAHGAVANTAARLEAANKDFGSTICIGPGTAAAVRETRLVKIGRAQLRGFDAPVDVFTINDPALIPPMPGRPAHGPEPTLSPVSAPLRET
jgi:adenylate cyclase